jgi:hypothetical protein
MGDIVA